MRVAIAGAGNVGRSIAQELSENGHQVLLIEKAPQRLRPERVPAAQWVLADACEVASLTELELNRCDVVVAATGDDKVNLVLSLLAKTEFAVNRVVARVNRAENGWLFSEQWGVDVSVSTPRMMAALVEEAVSVGDLVRLMTFRQSEASLVEITLPSDAPYIGYPTRDVPLPRDSSLVAVLRGQRVLVPSPDDPLESGDELILVCATAVETEVREVLLGPGAPGRVLSATGTLAAEGAPPIGATRSTGGPAVTGTGPEPTSAIPTGDGTSSGGEGSTSAGGASPL